MVKQQILQHFLQQIVILNFKYTLKADNYQNHNKKWYFMHHLLQLHMERKKL